MENQRIEHLIADIADAIRLDIDLEFESPTKDWGLYSGLLGKIIFLYYYSALTEAERDRDFADEALGKYLSNVRISSLGNSLCSGVAGILYGLRHLTVNGFADVDFKSVIPLFHALTIKNIEKTEKKCFYDLMYGLSGLGIISEKLGLRDITEAILAKMKEGFIQSADGSYLLFDDFETDNKNENISLSHGMSGVILFLSIIHASQKEHSDTLTELLSQSVHYLMSNRYPAYESVGSMFPYQSIKEESTKSRLAWCYGDLGIGIALRSAAKTLNDERVITAAKQLFAFNSTRLGVAENFVYDACICHGAAGISQIFRSASEFYDDDSNLRNAYQYWIDQVVSFSRFADGPAGYKKRIENDYLSSYNLLEGVAGIGLCLISYLRPDLSKWEELFFMNP